MIATPDVLNTKPMPTPKTRPTPPVSQPRRIRGPVRWRVQTLQRLGAFLIRHDHQRRVRLAAVQSPEGQALLAWAGLPVDQFDTMAVIRDRHYWERSDAFFEVISQLPARWQPLRLLRVFPRGLRDWAYDRIALNRYRLFGKYDTCLLPTPDHQQRFLKITRPES